MAEFSLWLEFEAWVPPGHDDESPYFNMRVDFKDGRSYAMNVWVTDAVPRIVRAREGETSPLAGLYSIGPDLIVERMDRKLIEDIVEELDREGALRDDWLCPPDDE